MVGRRWAVRFEPMGAQVKKNQDSNELESKGSKTREREPEVDPEYRGNKESSVEQEPGGHYI